MEKVTQRRIKEAAALNAMVREGLSEKLFAQRSEAGGQGERAAQVFAVRRAGQRRGGGS